MGAKSELVILTVYNRPEWMLANTLRALARNDLGDARVLIIDDGSDVEYGLFNGGMFEGLNITWVRANTIESRPQTYHIGGHNNPAFVNNLALDMAREWGVERLFWLSSDVLLPDHALKAARMVTDAGAVFTPAVVNTGTSEIFNHSSTPWPMMWFVASLMEWAEAAGPFDEKFLEGMAFEDNDYMARLCLEAGAIEIHDTVLAIHQSHPQVAYSDENKGFQLSEDYCKAKWGGHIPWRKNGEPLTCTALSQGKRWVRWGVERLIYVPDGVEVEQAS